MQIPGLPTLPTDTYYKFKALAGLWLIAGALVGYVTGFVTLQRDAFEVKLHATGVIVDVESLSAETRRELDRVEMKVSHAKTMQQALDRMAQAANQYVKELERSPHVTKEQLDEGLRRVAQIDAESARLERLHSDSSAEFERAKKAREGRRPAELALRKESAKILVVTEHLAALTSDLKALAFVAMVMTSWGVYFAATGLRQWSHMQQLQDEYLRRLWLSPEATPTPGHSAVDTPKPAPSNQT